MLMIWFVLFVVRPRIRTRSGMEAFRVTLNLVPILLYGMHGMNLHRPSNLGQRLCRKINSWGMIRKINWWRMIRKVK